MLYEVITQAVLDLEFLDAFDQGYCRPAAACQLEAHQRGHRAAGAVIGADEIDMRVVLALLRRARASYNFV